MNRNYEVVLLDLIDQVPKSKIKLLTKTTVFKAFNDVDTCVDHVIDTETSKIFLIISGPGAELAVRILDGSSQLDAIFVLCSDELQNEQWLLNHPRVKGVFNNMMMIMEKIEHIQCDIDNVIGFDVARKPSSSLSLENVHRNKYIDDPVISEKFIKFERDYKQYTAVWWYTKVFLFSILNKALRTHNISVLYPMRVFIQDLHQQIVQLHADSKENGRITLYRGQLIPIEESDKILKNPGGLLSINNFLSISTNQALAEMFAGELNTDPQMISVLFEIDVEPLKRTSSPFASIERFSNFGAGEQEYLFTMGSVFRIESIKISDTNRIWCVKLTWTSDNDPDLMCLTNSIRSVVISEKLSHTHICSLALLMMILDESELASEILETVLEGQVDPVERFKIYFTLSTLYTNLHDSQQALVNNEKVVNSYVLRFMPINIIAMIYYRLGELCIIQKKYKLALVNMEIAYGVEQLRLPKPDESALAHYRHAICQIHGNLGNNEEALSYCESAIESATRCFPRHHPFIAKCMLSRSRLLYQANRLEEVSSSLIESGQILANSLPTNHRMQTFVHLTNAHNFFEEGDWLNALESYRAALSSSHRHQSPYHPDNAPILWGIAAVYAQQSQLEIALSILQEALDIQINGLPPHHPNLAITYVQMGDILQKQGDLAALSYYEQALSIELKRLPSTHPRIVSLQQIISRLQYRS